MATRLIKRLKVYTAYYVELELSDPEDLRWVMALMILKRLIGSFKTNLLHIERERRDEGGRREGDDRFRAL